MCATCALRPLLHQAVTLIHTPTPLPTPPPPLPTLVPSLRSALTAMKTTPGAVIDLTGQDLMCGPIPAGLPVTPNPLPCS